MDILDSEIKQISDKLKIISDNTRLKILYCLNNQHDCHSLGSIDDCECLSEVVEKSVNQIVNELNLSQSLVSHQLKALKNSEFVTSRKEKRQVFYSLKDSHVIHLLKIIKEHVEEGNNDKESL